MRASILKTVTVFCLIHFNLVNLTAELKNNKKNVQFSEVVQSSQAIRNSEDFGNFPLYFIPNKGQFKEQVLFYTKAAGYALWLSEDSLLFDGIRKADSLKIKFLNKNKNTNLIALDSDSYKVNYLIGNDRSKWKTNIQTSKAVMYEEIYNYIDLKIYGKEKQIEYDWIVKPGADLLDICFKFQDSSETKINKNGDLIVNTAAGEIKHLKPISYQIIDGEKVYVDSQFRKIKENSFGLEVGKYEENYELIIDPVVLLFSTYIGGAEEEEVRDMAIDRKGAVYITGVTNSDDFPNLNSYQSKYQGNYDVFITKIDPNGNSLIYSTYLGGSASESGNGIAVDRKGNAYITGSTRSSNFPTVSPIQPAKTTGWYTDAFVSKLNTTGDSLIYSTYLAGYFTDAGKAITVDKKGCVYVLGETDSLGFPTKNPIQSKVGGYTDLFLSKINPTGDALIYSTYFGGERSDFGEDIAIDKKEAVYIAGWTRSSDFPVKNAFQKNYVDNHDGLLMKIHPKGNSVIFSTYFGGAGTDMCFSLDVDKKGSIYFTGISGGDLPIKNALQKESNGGGDSFFAKFKPNGKKLNYCSYLGGSKSDSAYCIRVDITGSAYIAGITNSTDFPLKNPYQNQNAGSYDNFIIKVNEKGNKLLFSTYLGGKKDDFFKSLVIGKKKTMFVTGYTDSTDFPTINPLFENNAGKKDIFLSKLKY